jgi:DNA-binding CsgD family transcriptional regulator/N-acetylneuraminic acid mutarotase
MPEQNMLSERETEILQLVATGLTNREIAQKLTISPNTVKVHLSNIFEKINVSSRTEATMYGIEHGIVDIPGVENGETVLTWQALVRKNISIIIPLFLIILAVIAALWRTVLFPPTSPTPVALGDIPERWQELAPMPEIRTGMALAAYDENIYAIAGEGPDGVSSNVFRYLTAEDRWEQLSDKPTPVADVEGALIGEKVYIPGGRLADGKPTDILEIYDPRQDIWEKGTSLPKKISNYAMADFEGKLFIFGGWDGEKPLTDVYVYDPEEDAWGERTPMGIARLDAGAVALADKIVVLGGRNSNGDLKDAKAYFPSRDVNDEKAWDDFIDLPYGDFGFNLSDINNSIYILGGHHSRRNDENISILYLENDKWENKEIRNSKDLFITASVLVNNIFFNILTDAELLKSEFLAYTAVYFDVYLPLIP